ncbi:hemolysin XhlA family protein [Bacillus sp. WMMC1349]|nr:hemolysin XhlA family protein [Bacillus sp. WMMC1349]
MFHCLEISTIIILKFIKIHCITIFTKTSTLERTTERHDQQIISINEKLNKIEENTTWIKRSIGAIITAISTGVIGGTIALFYNLLQK